MNRRVVLNGLLGLGLGIIADSVIKPSRSEAQIPPPAEIEPAAEPLPVQLQELRKNLLEALESRNRDYLGLGEDSTTEGNTTDINYLLKTLGELAKTENGLIRGKNLASVFTDFLNGDNAGYKLILANDIIEAVPIASVTIDDNLNGVSGVITRGNRSKVYDRITQVALGQELNIGKTIKDRVDTLFNKFINESNGLRDLSQEQYSRFGPELLKLVEKLSPELRADALYYLSQASMSVSNLFAVNFSPFGSIPELKDDVTRGETVISYLASPEGIEVEGRFDEFYSRETRQIIAKINEFGLSLNPTERERFYSFFSQQQPVTTPPKS